MEKGQVCGCPHHKFLPGLVVLFGLLSLLGFYNVVSMGFVAVGEPVLIIVFGLFMMFQNKCKCC